MKHFKGPKGILTNSYGPFPYVNQVIYWVFCYGQESASFVFRMHLFFLDTIQTGDEQSELECLIILRSSIFDTRDLTFSLQTCEYL